MKIPALLLLLCAALPAPALACDYAPGKVFSLTLYYELDASSLGASGQQTLDSVSQLSGCNIIYILSSHLDASEVASRPELGQARGDDARQRILARGVPKRDIFVRDMKFDSPAVPTAPGVREPLNRRVDLLVLIH
jgi:outer membrane protein OmpA-like peptidoglycan-associated protein